MGQACCSKPTVTSETDGASNDDFIKAFGGVGADVALAQVVAGLAKLIQEHPYLKPMGTEFAPHHLLYWVRRCREATLARNTEEAEATLERITSSLDYELKQVADAFRRFDHDNSGHLDGQEFKYLCAYIGWGEQEASIMDLDQDQQVTVEEFQRFVGHMGGLQQLFEQRRQRVSRKQWGVEAPAVIEVGARVQSYYRMKDGTKSKTYREAQVLELNVMPDNGIRLVFGFGEDTDQERQVVPMSWIFSDTRDSDVVAALREVGILEEQQAFWASIFPQSEMRAVQKLTACQRAGLANVRANAALNHEKALPGVRERFTKLGYTEAELQAVFGWIQDLAPMCIHIHIGNVGRFLETDEFYRSQFETGTSCGALDSRNDIRKGWERELFGGAYEDAKPFERCKYGALSVMNDYRGITSAYQYGDSYLVLKDVRLRTTFAATDSGGIAGSRLAVLDKYAHVLKEYNDRELHSLVEVALANTSMSDVPSAQPHLIRGMNVDTTAEWVTMGFPDLPQRKGRYYFEIEMFRGCQSPQAGLLSTNFVRAPRTQGMQGGVGDDQHGWGADGQHAILWHGGKKIAWHRCWKSSDSNARELADNVVLGVAVDIDACKIWFCSGGEWDEEGTPSFGPDRVAKGLALYPALSLKGRAAFNFGPEFTHTAPTFKGAPFVQWPGMADGKVRADCPLVGNSQNVGIYKEIQIHGEVNLKANVQRLVANRKHLEVAKNDRSWAIRVDGAGSANGIYKRSGARFGMPVYTQEGGGTHQLNFSKNDNMWRLVPSPEADEEWISQAPPVEGSFEPPREGWGVPKESRGVAPLAIFKAAMAKAGISDAACKKLSDALGAKNKDGDVVYRFADETSFNDEWAKIQAETKVESTADEAWGLCVKVLQDEQLSSSGFKNAAVVETEHPYAAKSASWTKDVCLESAKSLKVVFSSKCNTYDDCAHLQIFAGGMQKSSAGVGARAHLKALTGPDQVHGTIAGKAEGGKWVVNIDRDEGEICGGFREWLEASPGRQSTAICAQEMKVVEITYENGATVGDEIEGFKLDRACPMTPFTVSGFKGSGPAQKEGVMIGWVLDVVALLEEEEFASLEGEEFGPAPESLAEIADNLDGFQKRLEALRGMSNVTLVFYNGLDFQLLPCIWADYKGKKVSDEITGFSRTESGTVRISSLVGNGPAKEAGAKDGWEVSLVETFNLQDNKKALEGLDRQQVADDPSLLLPLSDVKLMLEPSNAEPTSYFKGYGSSGMFTSCTIPFNNVQFVWTTDGDGSSSPDRRWGFFAVVASADDSSVDQEAVDALVNSWDSAIFKVQGCGSDSLSIEPEDWDESRLRALCAKHNWEFEWMTEDGERRRRIEGAERARKVAAKAHIKETAKGAESTGAWWRLDAVAKAFTYKTPAVPVEPAKKPLLPPPKITSKKVQSNSSLNSDNGRVKQEGADPAVSKVDVKDVKLVSKPSHR
eukprot:TRINITY_DN47308_c0_g1_i1.p1 TRINITY_DN47308_c0_g1~~TRINITY_DN47308_c0_g1_i1.p1  ORF type:complete len:1465 (+),score=355.71 TRINITY_DN47308_c0_g1_i1:40-4395(+)